MQTIHTPRVNLGQCPVALPIGIAYGHCRWALPMGNAHGQCPWALPWSTFDGTRIYFSLCACGMVRDPFLSPHSFSYAQFQKVTKKTTSDDFNIIPVHSASKQIPWSAWTTYFAWVCLEMGRYPNRPSPTNCLPPPQSQKCVQHIWKPYAKAKASFLIRRCFPASGV